MFLKPNKLKKVLKKNKVAYGTCIYSFNPNLMELAGYSGLDFCRIDNEHAWRQDNSLEQIIRAAVIGEIVPIARIDKGNLSLIRKVLEIGASGFIIPDIKTPEEVKQIVTAAKFPPLGNRGYSNRCFSGGNGTTDHKEWMEWSNRETLVGIMIETREAVEQINAIMAIKGLDFVLFGPADYSLSLGFPEPNKNHPDVQSAIIRTAEAAIKYKKYAMIGIGAPWKVEAEKYIQMGYNLIELGGDYPLLYKAWSEALKEAKLK